MMEWINGKAFWACCPCFTGVFVKRKGFEAVIALEYFLFLEGYWIIVVEELERVKGFEPSTSTLARLRSTPELRPRILFRMDRDL